MCGYTFEMSRGQIIFAQYHGNCAMKYVANPEYVFYKKPN